LLPGLLDLRLQRRAGLLYQLFSRLTCILQDHTPSLQRFRADLFLAPVAFHAGILDACLVLVQQFCVTIQVLPRLRRETGGPALPLGLDAQQRPEEKAVQREDQRKKNEKRCDDGTVEVDQGCLLLLSERASGHGFSRVRRINTERHCRTKNLAILRVFAPSW